MMNLFSCSEMPWAPPPLGPFCGAEGVWLSGHLVPAQPGSFLRPLGPRVCLLPHLSCGNLLAFGGLLWETPLSPVLCCPGERGDWPFRLSAFWLTVQPAELFGVCLGSCSDGHPVSLSGQAVFWS